MITFKDKRQTISGFGFTKHIKRLIRVENDFTLVFELDTGGEDFINLLDIADELNISLYKLCKDDLIMDIKKQTIIEECDAVMQGFAIWYDTSSSDTTLKIIYVENQSYKAVMSKIMGNFEVSGSNMPTELLYKMKFVIERNKEIIESEWTGKKNKDKKTAQNKIKK